MFILSEKEPQNRSIVFPSVLNKFFKWCWARAALGDRHNGVDGSQHRCCRIVSKNFFFLFWENVVKILLKKSPIFLHRSHSPPLHLTVILIIC